MSDKDDQYRDPSGLRARSGLHARFSTSKVPWLHWVFDHLKLGPLARILELGCGTGGLWSQNSHRIPEGWDIALSDKSPGMLTDSQASLTCLGREFGFQVIDAQSIAFRRDTFDAVIANHMLYHAEDRRRAFSEIRRVLKPGGRLYATTNGRGHMQELTRLVRRVDPELHMEELPEERFGLENGFEQLSEWFPRVTSDRHESFLRVTEAGPLTEYVLSTRRGAVVRENLGLFTQIVEHEIAKTDGIVITQEPGIFEAIKGA